jgi:FkbM family methyltransferase
MLTSAESSAAAMRAANPGVATAQATSLPDLIYDVGAHDGQDSAFYLKKGFRVVAVECNPSLVEGLRQRFRTEAEEGRFILVPAAIAAEPGEIEFFVNESLSIWSTADQKLAARNQRMGAPSRSVRVEARTFQSILSEFGVPHYLKIDIEGFDMLCVEALKDFTVRPKFLSLESSQESWSAIKRELEVLTALGYGRFHMVCQSMVPEQTPPLEAREGKYVEHAFPHGATGLFGDELPGEWIDRNEALRRYLKVFLKYKAFGHNTLGGALLRRIDIGPLKYRLLPAWWDTHAALS